MLKTCTYCLCTKNIIEFNHYYRSPDGHKPICKECQRSKFKEYYHKNNGDEVKRNYYIKNRSDIIEKNKKHSQLIKRKIKYDPKKQPARMALNKAVYMGKIIKPNECSNCGKVCKPEAHHYNGYDLEHRFDVVWLCTTCHSLEHHKEYKERISDAQ